MHAAAGCEALAHHAGGLEEFAGQCGRQGTADGPRRVALFTDPKGLCYSPLGFLAVADAGNACIRSVNMAGTGLPCMHPASYMHAHAICTNPRMQERYPPWRANAAAPGMQTAMRAKRASALALKTLPVWPTAPCSSATAAHAGCARYRLPGSVLLGATPVLPRKVRGSYLADTCTGMHVPTGKG